MLARPRRGDSSSTSSWSRSRAPGRTAAPTPSPPIGDWSSRSRCRRSSDHDRREFLLQALDDLRGLVHRQRGLRDVRDPARVGQLEVVDVAGRLHEDDVVGRALRWSPRPPRDLVPDQDDRVPLRRFRASTCTLVTSGQVASIVRSRRAAEFSCTLGATPWAENTTSTTPEPRTPPRRRSRRASRAAGRRACCGRSPCARTRAGREGRARARRSARRDRRRREYPRGAASSTRFGVCVATAANPR